MMSAHAPGYPPRQLSASSPLARSTTPQRVPWVPSMTHPAKALAQRAGLRADRILSQMRPRLVDGDDGVEIAPGSGCLRSLGQHDQQVGPVAVELGLVVKVGVLPGILPAVAALSFLRPSPGTWRLSSRRYRRRERRRRGSAISRSKTGRATNSPPPLRSTNSRWALTRTIASGGAWARAMPLDGIVRSAARSSAVVRAKSRLADRSFVLCCNSFTSLRSAAVHRTAPLARESEQTKRRKRPPITGRTPAPPYRPSFRRPLSCSIGGVQEIEFGN